MADRWTVSEVASVAGVSVRTLHHYDRIGLLEPSARSDAGYRLYSQDELDRLQRILLYRELRFSLEEIAGLLDDPAVDRAAALKAQRSLLAERRRRLSRVIRTVDRTLDTIEEGRDMSAEEMFDGFEELANAPADVREHHRKHAREAHERWGDGDAYATSTARAKDYSREQWEAIKREGAELEARMAGLLEAGADPRGEEALEGAEAMRRHIDRWFYPCSPGMHAGLADTYESDERFRAHYNDRADGLASFVATAIRANAERATEGSS